MKKIYLKAFVVIFLAGITLFSPQLSSAFSVTYLDPAYNASQFLTLNDPIASIAFDSNMNLYTEKTAYFGTGTAIIDKLAAATAYTTSSTFSSYPTSARGINGLSFYQGGGILLASEFNASLNSGSITTISSTGSKISTLNLPNFRPTGMTNDSVGNIFFPVRLDSTPGFGDIYKIDTNGTMTLLVSGFVGTGIAYYSGNLFVSTAAGVDPNHIDNSIYKINIGTGTETLFATFDKTIEELTFDKWGNLYAIDVVSGTQPTTIIEISPVPEPSTMLLLGAGLVGLIGFRRKFKK